jgi:hypothetical protein
MDMQPMPSAPKSLGYFDYLKAAFNFRVPVKGLGGVPVNWLYLAAMGGLGVAAWPMLLIGAAGEIGFLTWMAGSKRFQRVVRASRRAKSGVEADAQTDAIMAKLSQNSRTRYEAIQKKCQDIVDIAGQTSDADAGSLETYAMHLAELRDVYVHMLAQAELLAKYSKDWSETDPLPEIAALEKEMEANDMTEAMHASRQATLDILRRRAQHREEISHRAQVVHSEIERLEQQIALLRDQALLTGDPSILSGSMDVAAGMLEDRNEWLTENAAFVNAISQLEQQQ